MAITQVGSTFTTAPNFGFGGSHENTGLVVSTITVPTGTELVLVGVSHFTGRAGGLEALTFTKNGQDAPMTRCGNAGDLLTSSWQGALFYLALPDIGANKSLKYDWSGSGTSPSGSEIFSMSYWAGVDIASPVRSSAGTQGDTLPLTTGTLTAQTGDKIVAWCATFCNGQEGNITAWSNATLLSNEPRLGDADGAWAYADPTGNQTVGVTTATHFDSNALIATVLKPPGATGYVPIGVEATAGVGDAFGSPVRNIVVLPPGDPMTASSGTISEVDTFVIKGRVAVFGWGVR